MIRQLSLLIVCTGMLAGCGAPATPEAAPTQSAALSTTRAAPTAPVLIDLKVCYSAPTTTQAVPWYALENGLFEKHGLKVELLRVQGSAQAVTTLITGDSDLCQAAGSSVVNAAAAGQDVVMIAGIYNTYPAVLVASASIKSTQDLRGKRVGTGLTASASEVATRLALGKLGLDPDTDVAMVQIGEEPERVAAFRAGQVDAMLTTPPYLHILRGEGVSELFDFGAYNIPYAHTSVLTTRKFVSENREVTIRFMKAMIEAIARMKQDPDGTKQVIAKYLELDPVADADDLADAYDNIVLPLVQELPYPNLEGLQTLITFTAVTNPDAADLDPAALADLSIVREIEASGFIAEVQGK